MFQAYDRVRGLIEHTIGNATYMLDDERTWHRKINYASDQRLAGVFIWRLELDDYEVSFLSALFFQKHF